MNYSVLPLTKLTEHFARLPEKSVGVAGSLLKSGLNQLFDLSTRLSLVHQMVNVITVALLRRDSSGGSMRLFEQSHFRKLAHLVSYSGGRHGNRKRSHKRLRADRFAGFYILFHNSGKYQFFSFPEFHAFTSFSVMLALVIYEC